MSKLHKLILSACGAALIAVAPMAVQAAQPAQLAAEAQVAVPGYTEITPQEARKMMEVGNVTILDVRRHDEFVTGHVKGAVNIPHTRILEMTPGAVLSAVPNTDATVLVYCGTGKRAGFAGRKLAELGYKNVYNFLGTKQWPYELVK